MFIHTNHKEVTQLPTDHNAVSTINECDDKILFSNIYCNVSFQKVLKFY